MKIKTKISLGIAYLVVIIILIGGLGTYYLQRLDSDARSIINDNYHTLSYIQQMFKSLADIQNALEKELIEQQNITNLSINQKGFRESLSAFEQALEEQSINVTEPGEKELTGSLRKNYSELITLFNAPLDQPAYAQYVLPVIKNINGYLTSIFELNQDMVLEKNDKARSTADRVIAFMLSIGSISMFIALSFLLIFPNYMARPTKKMKESIKETDQTKITFMSAISHEMKTPISSIKMSLQLLEDERIGMLNDEQKELVLYIKDESERLLQITREMMELPQAKSGQIQVKAEVTSPDDIVNYALHKVKMLAEEKQVILEYPQDTDLPDVDADAEKTAWIMGSLLTNAIQNSGPGKKVIVDIVEKNNKIRFSVEDFGEYILEEQAGKIFDPYFQPPEHFRSGDGLELSLLRKSIQEQKGTIWVESKAGTGNKICFTLPYSKKPRNKVQ